MMGGDMVDSEGKPMVFFSDDELHKAALAILELLDIEFASFSIINGELTIHTAMYREKDR
jgi:hypothetical protein